MFLKALRPPVRRGRTARLVAGVALVAAVLPLTTLAGVATATTPRPAPGAVPGENTTAFDRIEIFYQQVNHRLAHRTGGANGFDPVSDLGGVLTSGPAAITIGSEFATTAVFARGADNAVWFRQFFDGLGEWGPWTSAGGRALGAPGVSCVGDFTAPPTVYIRGTDRALWRRALGGAWQRLGGVLGSDPGPLPAAGGGCPSREDVFVLGSDRTVWEYVGGAFRRVGGRSVDAPAAVELPGGQTALFVRGTDNALWENNRTSPTARWQGWHRVGGILTSAPVVNSFPAAPRSYALFALGADGNLWRGRNVVGTSTWRWDQVP